MADASKTRKPLNASKKVVAAKSMHRRKTKPAEQTARLAAFNALVEKWKMEWNALSLEEQRQEEDAWKRVMRRMNLDRKGYRQLFVDGIER